MLDRQGGLSSGVATGTSGSLDVVVAQPEAVDAAALAVHAHRRGDDEALDRVLREPLEQRGGPELVDRGVLGDPVHAPAGAHRGREVDHRVHPPQRAVDRLRVAHVPHPQVDVRVEPGRRLHVGPVDLLGEVVEDAHVPSPGQERVAHVGPDEAGAPADQHSSCHAVHSQRWVRVGPRPACEATTPALAARRSIHCGRNRTVRFDPVSADASACNAITPRSTGPRRSGRADGPTGSCVGADSAPTDHRARSAGGGGLARALQRRAWIARPMWTR
jgi:hypothetical protein